MFLPGDKTKEQKIDSIVRVDQAGEYGALRIYLGQMAALKDDQCYHELKEMYEHEQQHLNYFNQQIQQNQYRPTILQPIWHVGGFLLGFLGGKIEAKCAMAITAAIEEEIAAHYLSQIEELEMMYASSYIMELKETITQFRNEEMEHENIGLSYSDEHQSFYPKVRFITMLISKTAIWLSKRI